LMVTANYQGQLYAHVLFTIGKQDYRWLGNGLLDYDGHGTFSPDGRWMVTDTYPGRGLREQKIYLMDMETEAVLPLGRFVQPEAYTGYCRCDIHCRWSPRGDMIGFNSTHTNSRQVYIFKLE
jgi:Tol biopolymer transport system component